MDKTIEQKELRDKGMWYCGLGTGMITEIFGCSELCQKLNRIPARKVKKRQKLYQKLFCKAGKGLQINSPFHCDYGYNISFGEDCLVNFNAVFLDCAKITIGNRVLMAPNVALYAVTHHMDITKRNLTKADPIVIEDDVWIGGNVVILAGVTIGKGSIIGAGSVVTKSIPAGVLAFGNPCKPVRKF